MHIITNKQTAIILLGLAAFWLLFVPAVAVSNEMPVWSRDIGLLLVNGFLLVPFALVGAILVTQAVDNLIAFLLGKTVNWYKDQCRAILALAAMFYAGFTVADIILRNH